MLGLVIGIPIVLVLSGLGGRVLWRARQARAGTDALVGVYFMCLGIGAIPALLAGDPGVFSPSTGPWAMAFGHLIMSIGFGALYVFVWRCFGAESGLRLWLAMVGCSGLAMLYVLQGVVEGFEPPGGGIVRMTALVRAGALVWALYESLRYWQLMRRRVRLGLGDPLVANRFLLWCLWMGGMLGAIGLAITIRFAVPEFGPDAHLALRLGVLLLMSALCGTASASLWLAFFAPGWYTRWISDRSAAQPA